MDTAPGDLWWTELEHADIKLEVRPPAPQGPVLLNPVSTTRPTNFVMLQEYVAAKRAVLLRSASEYGSVLFRGGFDIKSAEEWHSILTQLGLKPMEYVGGAAVRKLTVGSPATPLRSLQIVTSNESPASEPIPFHHELAQTPHPPDHICFYCVENSTSHGGATPIARSDLLMRWLKETHPAFVAKLKGGVRYVKVAPANDDPSSALGRSWKSMFGCQQKDEAEHCMREQGYEFEWLPNDDCRITSPKLAATRPCSNGTLAFFNQIVAAYTGWTDSRNDPKKAVLFADDASPMPAQVLDEVTAWLDAHNFGHRWQPGDFMIVDNTVSCHARQPFPQDGKRCVLAAISRGIIEPPAPLVHTTTVLSLHSGDIMPGVGLGCWKLNKALCTEIVYQAIKAGYRLIDSACDYGNEVEVGLGIKRALEEGVCRRDELFVVSKLWNTFHAHVDEGIRKTLDDMQLDYLDLYLIHFPIALKYVPIDVRYPPEWFHDPNAKSPCMEFNDSVAYHETWAAMESLHDRKLVRNIGCCNVGTPLLRQMLAYARVKPAVLQVEMHPYNAQAKLLRYAREHGIQVTAYSNLGAASYVELGMAKPEDSLLEHHTVKEHASNLGKTPAQILLRWAIQRGTAIIPKSEKSHRLRENFDVFDFSLTPEQMESIDRLDCGRRYNDPGNYCEVAFNTFCPIFE